VRYPSCIQTSIGPCCRFPCLTALDSSCDIGRGMRRARSGWLQQVWYLPAWLARLGRESARRDVQREQTDFETIPSDGVGLASHGTRESRHGSECSTVGIGAHPGPADGPRKYDGDRARGSGKTGPGFDRHPHPMSLTPHPRPPRPRPQGNGASGGVAAHGSRLDKRGTSEPTVTPQPDHLPLRNDPMLTCPCRPLGRPVPIHMCALFI